LWDVVDDAPLGTITTLATTVLSLDEETGYFVALFARDSFGNISATGISVAFTTYGLYGLSGTAVDQNGYIMAETSVYMYRKDTGVRLVSLTTNPDGTFTILGGFPVLDTSFYIVFYRESSADPNVFWGAAIIDEVPLQPA